MASSLAERVRDPGYTPGVRDLPALLALLSEEDDDLARATERAILRIETRHLPRIVAETVGLARDAVRPARGRLVKLVGRLATGAPEDVAKIARDHLVASLEDGDLKSKHTAARALGKLPAATAADRTAVENALVAAFDRAQSEDDRRPIADALGKIGSQASRSRLEGTRAALMIDRTLARETPGAIDLGRELEGSVTVRFHARSGLEPIVAEELGDEWRPRVAGPGIVDGRLTGPLSRALAIRTALHCGFPLDPVPVKGDLAETIVAAITGPRALAILRGYTQRDGANPSAGQRDRDARPPIRFRIAWARGGHRRALTWRCAELIAAKGTELVNDPTASTWEILVDDLDDRVAIELVPRGFEDPRFQYRQATVPAASHPTIAAALVRLVPPRDGDVVWDPFVGSGAELVERARLGKYAALYGTDLESDAVEATRKNLAAAGITDAAIEIADGTTYAPRRVSVIITNPPMGRRVQRGGHLELLEKFVDHAAHVLGRGGALVWAVPEAQKLHARAERAGLVLERSLTVDMGGFPAELSVHRKSRS